MYQNFLVDKDDMIVVITLNRPEKCNPINEERRPLTLPNG